MNLPPFRNRVLDPLERFSEIVFGLIMVLSFTCVIDLTRVGEKGMRAMLVGAIGCNLAWGIIDAVFYLIACLAEQGHRAALLRRIQQTADLTLLRKALAEALPPVVADTLQADDFDRIHASLKKLPAPAARLVLTWENWRGALGVFLLVFLSTFPVVIPFMVFHDAQWALRVSNGVAILLLYGAGYMLAGHAGLPRVITGLSMVGIGATLVAITRVLGG